MGKGGLLEKAAQSAEYALKPEGIPNIEMESHVDRRLPSEKLPPHLRRPRLRRWEAAEYLGLVHGLQIAPATLAKLASIGGGPAFHRANRTPFYPVDELDRWAEARLGGLVHSTSEPRP
jgi:hypothetical protein